ncbi:MAG: hypothetical protein AABX78_01830 [Nanoarchaeota archaeon]
MYETPNQFSKQQVDCDLKILEKEVEKKKVWTQKMKNNIVFFHKK